MANPVRILPDLSAMQAEIAKLKAENEALKAKKAKGISLKVSDKGALSVYGIGRFPVTLYRSQWLKVLDAAEDIRKLALTLPEKGE